MMEERMVYERKNHEYSKPHTRVSISTSPTTSELLLKDWVESIMTTNKDSFVNDYCLIPQIHLRPPWWKKKNIHLIFMLAMLKRFKK